MLVADAPEASARGACVQAAAVASGRAEGDVLRAWAPATRLVAVPRPGSNGGREAAYAVLAARDALDTDTAGSGETTV
ncbi:hypothetical protein [Streptomyces sp. cg40]|uniref:hypothetical protein n=1 Tax=Streptomyces sp. cg40 TaxID=3419764 RepID=UPI003D04AE60